MTSDNSMTTAVVLSGGAAYAAYEVGAMKALFNGESEATQHMPINPRIFTGTSAGSFNASFMVSRPETDSSTTVALLENVWLNEVADNPKRCGNRVYRVRGDMFKFFDLECISTHPLEPFVHLVEDSAFLTRDWLTRAMNFALSPESLGQRTLRLVDLSTVISTEPFHILLRDTISLDGIRDSAKILRITAANWVNGTLRIFMNEDISGETGYKAIMASSAVPGFFPPVEIDGQIYVDGGVLMNTPLNLAIDAGADVLHVIYLDPDVQTIPNDVLQSTLRVFERMIIIKMADTYNRDVETAQFINHGLEILEQANGDERLSNTDMQVFIRVASRIKQRIQNSSPYKKLTIHRYHPREDLGGILGLLNFDRRRVMNLIERGFKDVTEHDCASSGCVIPAPR